MHEGRMQTGWRTANAGSRLKPPITQEGTAWKASLPAVLRENPPYGMIGGIEETSASFEARFAPRSYPTNPVPHDRRPAWQLSEQVPPRRPRCSMALIDPGCVKTLFGITAPRILRLVVTLRAKKCKNSSFARHYDQFRFRFRTAWTH